MPEDDAAVPLCFAYGSNMDRAAMATRCPRSVAFGPARLPGFRFGLMAEGYATVRPDPRGTVWGLLWEMALADGPALDRYEAVSEGLYRKVYRPVLTEGGPRRALVYVGRQSPPGRPLPGYMEGVLAAARSIPLPDGYLRELSAHRPSASTGPSRSVTPTRRSPLDPLPVRPAWTWSP